MQFISIPGLEKTLPAGLFFLNLFPGQVLNNNFVKLHPADGLGDLGFDLRFTGVIFPGQLPHPCFSLGGVLDEMTPAKDHGALRMGRNIVITFFL